VWHAYSGGCRTLIPISVGQRSDFCRTAFRFLPDTVPIHIGQRSGLMPDSFGAPLEWCPVLRRGSGGGYGEAPGRSRRDLPPAGFPGPRPEKWLSAIVRII
jgi:hypothetical protein